MPPGAELIAKGTIVSATKSLIIAESRVEQDGKLVASGSGTFMRPSDPQFALRGLFSKL